MPCDRLLDAGVDHLLQAFVSEEWGWGLAMVVLGRFS